MPRHLVDQVRAGAQPFATLGELQPFIDTLGRARLVLLGEASHGTHEFYALRAEITKALITRHGFNCVAVEADWPDAYRVDRWVRGVSDDPTAEGALGDFTRFPRWMWRNTDVTEFATWLRDLNSGRAPGDRVGFYGLDLYSLHRSIESVLTYLRRVDPEAADRAKARYGCFEMFGDDPQSYGYMTSLGLSRDCEDEATAQLVELQRRALDYANRDGRIAADDYFFAEQNARLVTNAETYYRAMFAGRAESWNIRDRHMMETLEALMRHLGRPGTEARAVVWAHNSHLGDARATDMARTGELNLGQLVRERYGDEAWLVGFTTHTGTVTAARDWDDPAERRRVRPSLAGSYEWLFHDTRLPQFLAVLRGAALGEALRGPLLERAIGVIYRPETERASHYFGAKLAEQFDAVIHVDTTSALQPLEKWAHDESDIPETFPTGM